MIPLKKSLKDTKSAVAGIVDKNGGMRVVVSHPLFMKFHVNEDEQIYVLPNLEVQEPISWNEIPALIEKVKQHIG